MARSSHLTELNSVPYLSSMPRSQSSSITEGRLSPECQTFAHHPRAHYFSSSPSTMARNFSSGMYRRLRMERMADEDLPSDEIETMRQGHLGQDPRSQSSLATRHLRIEKDFGWPSDEGTRENDFHHFSKDSSRFTVDDSSEMTSSPSRYDDSSSSPFTPTSSQNAQDPQSFPYGYQGR